MRLRPVENTPEPEYPDYDKFHQDRRDFLRRVGTLAGAILAGAGLAGCGKEEPQRLGGVIAAPQPLPPKEAPVPPEHLPGRVVAPNPIEQSPEPRIAGGMRAPCPVGEEGVLVEPDPSQVPELPKDSPK